MKTALIEAASRAGRLGDGGDRRRRRAQTDARSCAARHRTALANKECLVSAGTIFMAEVARAKTTLLPVDSEHSAAMQAMAGARPERIERICLTASGGPFRSWSVAQMETRNPEQASQPPQLVDGTEGHHRFGHADEQGARAP